MNYAKAQELARKLRKNQTSAEIKFWKNVRNKRFYGLKFNRQFLIKYTLSQDSINRYFIADFYCHEHRLIIEIDGNIHLKQVEYDHHREQILKGLGYNILRFSNEQVMTQFDQVNIEIKEYIQL